MIEPLGLSLAELFTQPVVVSVFASMLVAYTILFVSACKTPTPYLSLFLCSGDELLHSLTLCFPIILPLRHMASFSACLSSTW